MHRRSLESDSELSWVSPPPCHKPQPKPRAGSVQSFQDCIRMSRPGLTAAGPTLAAEPPLYLGGWNIVLLQTREAGNCNLLKGLQKAPALASSVSPSHGASPTGKTAPSPGFKDMPTLGKLYMPA